MPVLVIMIDWFAPGYKAGGPIRSIVNLVRILRHDFEIYIFTSDRDFGDQVPYDSVKLNQWESWESGVKVWYASPDRFNDIEAELRKLNPQAVYLNSMFSRPFTIQPIRWHMRKSLAAQVVLAPRGMLHSGAIQYGTRKKQLFLNGIKLLGAQKKIIWQATDEQEAKDVQVRLGRKARVKLVGNAPTTTAPEGNPAPKAVGSLKVLYVSRIQPKKNLAYFLQSMARSSGSIHLDLIGPIEDLSYWKICQDLIAGLPLSSRVTYVGSFPHHQIMEMQQAYHLFVLPTHGENFGHAIFDALLGGLPVLLSDQTPWTDVEAQGCGWAVPLDHPVAFDKALATALAWDEAAFQAASSAARKYANAFLDRLALREQYLDLFTPQQIPAP